MAELFERFSAEAGRLARHEFVRNTLTLQAGTFASLLLGVVSSVVFARILGAATFGEYALISAVAAVASIPFDLGVGYGATTLLAAAYGRQDRTAIRDVIAFFVKASFVVAAVVGIPVMALTVVAVRAVYGNPAIGLWALPLLAAQLILPGFIFLTVVYQAERRFALLTVVENIQKLLVVAVPVALVLAGFGIGGIVFGNLVAAVVSVALAVWLYRRAREKDPLLPGIREILGVLRAVRMGSYLRFSITIALDKNIANLFSTLPVLFLGRLAVPAAAGYYKIAFSYVQLPLRLVGAVSRLLNVELPQSLAEGPRVLGRRLRRATVWAGVAGAGLTVLAAAAAWPLVWFLYGPAFLPVTAVVWAFVPFAVASGFSVGMGPAFRALDRVRDVILINLGALAAVTPLGYFAIARWGAVGAALTLGAYAIVATGAAFWVIYRHLGRLTSNGRE